MKLSRTAAAGIIVTTALMSGGVASAATSSTPTATKTDTIVTTTTTGVHLSATGGVQTTIATLNLSWSFDYPYDPAMDEAIGQIMGSCKAILLGRRTYQEFAPAWSGRTAEEDPGAPFMNESPKYAVSASLQTGRRCWIRHRGRSSRWLWRGHLAPGRAEMDPLGLRLG